MSNYSSKKRVNENVLEMIGQNLENIRAFRGLSQRQLSFLAGIDNADISRIEKGHINVTITTLHRLAKGLDVELSFLLIDQFK